MSDKAKEQLLEELFEVRGVLEKRAEIQGQMIKKFQLLIENEGLFSQIIDFFPYPVAIFTPEYTLVMVNKAFETEAKMRFINPGKRAARILKHKISDLQLASALNRVFSGETFFLEDLKDPFSMFSGIANQSVPETGRFNRAVIFPVPADSGSEISHGVIAFMT